MGRRPASPQSGGREPDDLDEMLAEVAADPEATKAYADALWRRAFFTRLAGILGDQRQRDVATRMRTTQSAVSDLEQGRVDPRLSTVQRYVRAIGAHVDVALVAHGEEPFELTVPRVVPFADELTEDRGLSGVLSVFADESDAQAKSPGAVAEHSGLPEPTVSYTMGQLKESGWLVQNEQVNDAEPLFSLSERRGLLIGVCVRRNFVQAALTDLRTNMLSAVETKLADTSPEEVVRAIAEALRDLQGEMTEAGDLVGLGVALAGRVDGGSGRVVSAPTLQGDGGGWFEVPLEEMLEEAATLHAAVENDAYALAMHTHQLAGARRDSYIVLITADEISAGYVVGGRLANGDRGLAGQIGHITVRPGKDRCSCGATGCLNTVAGPAAIVTAISRACGGEVVSIGQAAYLVPGSEEAEQVFRRAGAALGSVLASVLSALGLPEVVLYGPDQLTADDQWPSAAAYLAGVREAVGSAAVLGVGASVHARPVDPTLLCRAAAASARRHFLQRPRRWLPSLGRTAMRPEPTIINLHEAEREPFPR